MPKYNILTTPESENIPAVPHDYYPRPQFKRDSYISLNGLWDFAVTYDNKASFDRKILVPFCPQSSLSGIGETFKKGAVLHYRRRFSLPDGFNRGRVILNVGATDQIAEVFLNGKEIGSHIGGYLPFSFDITEFLADDNELYIKVYDDPHDTTLPYGKQKEKRGGMWYTPVSGIWQSVWLESVPNEYIKGIKIDTDIQKATIKIDGAESGTITLHTIDGEEVSEFSNGIAVIAPKEPIYWSPENPHLYNFTLSAGEDKIESYFALRELSVKTVDGTPRLCLNGKPYFFHGLLDQGYFSDGIYTPATEEGFTRDILSMKELGFNTLRKHIKIEPERFYYDCDRLGMIVFQDMVNNGKYSFFRDTALPTIGLKCLPAGLFHLKRKTRAAFIKGMEDTVAALYNHPSICLWTIFNEGWGQFSGNRMYRHLCTLDKSRFIDTASGWFFCRESDIVSPHIYFKKIKIKPKQKPTLISEFGGYSYQVEGHIFNDKREYGYSSYKTQEEFESAFVALYENEVIPAVKQGLCGAVYTQVSDVEDETNGLWTYDRRVLKVSPEKLLPIAENLKF